MIISLTALDYSRPVRLLLEQEPRPGSVHSVFQRAINITLDNGLLALLSDELPRMPNSVRIPARAMQELVSNLEPGMQAWVGRRELSIPICDYQICLPDTPPWEPVPKVDAHRWDRKLIEQRTDLVAQYLSEQSRSEGLAPLAGPLLLKQPAEMSLLLTKALPRLRLLMDAGRRLDLVDIEEATRGLAGLGPGLTPSGDDVLAGFAAILALLGPFTGMMDINSRNRYFVGAGLPRPCADYDCSQARSVSMRQACHSERSEESVSGGRGGTSGERILRFAQNDMGKGTPIADLGPESSLWVSLSSQDNIMLYHTIAENIAAVAGSRTTTLSAALLAHAARGEVAEPVKAWLMALPSDSLSCLLRATGDVMSIGNTSGGDILLGLLLGLRTLTGAVDSVGANSWSYAHS
jgi:hypothetical protein